MLKYEEKGSFDTQNTVDIELSTVSYYHKITAKQCNCHSSADSTQISLKY